CLQGASPPSQASLAEALGMSETAVKVAIHRLRKRFREAVKAEIAETLRDPATVGEELRHLVQALAGES
ncbi:MAG: sigma-70 family RNA polymerase sigma factor, partial [Verrucomicrobiales bacterium]|nr:sigma-70 family RNA polymerase sigma factor [Verrucomicrobiales bacterium]